MEYGASLTYEDQIIDMEDPNFLVPKAAGGNNRSTTPLSQESTDSCHNNEAFEKGELDVVVKRVESTHICSGSQDVMPAYKMTAYPRGLALIIEIEEFVNNVEKPRIGSHVDVENLSKLFQQLHFKAEHKKNLSRPQFLTCLREFANNPDHRKADMMILAVLSHGRDGQIIASDGLVVETEDIYAKFNNSNCPLLQGKPKFFIVQACRGDDTDVSFPENVEMFSDLEPRRAMKRTRGHDYDTVPIPSYGELNTARPTWEDMIIAYSTIPGFTSQRDHHSGTWFIQSLVETFMNHAHDRELIDLLRMTSDYLSKFTNDDGEKQTCNVEMRHLYKRIYFKPGLKGDNRRISMDASKMSPLTLRRSLSTPPSSPARRIPYLDQDGQITPTQ